MRPLDDFLPAYEFSERHRLAIAAPPERTDEALRTVSLGDIPAARVLWAMRRLGRPWGDAKRPFVEGALNGAVVLDDVPGEGMILGLTGQFWRLRGGSGKRMGVLLLSASWEGLYDALQLPAARPALYAQIAGGLLLGYAYLLWTGVDTPARRKLAGTTAAVNTAGVLVVGSWLVSGELDVGTLGEVILWLAVAALAAFAAAEIRIVRKPT